MRSKLRGSALGAVRAASAALFLPLAESTSVSKIDTIATHPFGGVTNDAIGEKSAKAQFTRGAKTIKRLVISAIAFVGLFGNSEGAFSTQPSRPRDITIIFETVH